jgi:hypothetical protein
VKYDYYLRLNAIAQRYESASEGVAKREALRDYLCELRVLAALADPQEGYPYMNFDPLYELVESLRGIETPPLLRPPARKAGARPTQRSAQWRWARASALITILMKKYDKDEGEESSGDPGQGAGETTQRACKIGATNFWPAGRVNGPATGMTRR